MRGVRPARVEPDLRIPPGPVDYITTREDERAVARMDVIERIGEAFARLGACIAAGC